MARFHATDKKTIVNFFLPCILLQANGCTAFSLAIWPVCLLVPFLLLEKGATKNSKETITKAISMSFVFNFFVYFSRPYVAILGRVPRTDIYKDISVYNAVSGYVCRPCSAAALVRVTAPRVSTCVHK